MVRTYTRRAWFACLLCILPTIANAQPLEIGIFPYLTSRGVIHTYEPLRAHLEARLGKPLILVSAPDFRTFLERTQSGAYPLVITAPHFARLAQLEAGYVPLLMAETRLSGVVVTATEAPWTAPHALKGHTVLMPDALSIVSILGLELLAQEGLEVGRDVTVRYTLTHADAAIGAGRGDAAAAIISRNALPQFSRAIQDQLRVIGETGEAPHIMLLAHPDLDAKLRKNVTDAVQAFSRDPTEGRAFVGIIGTGALRPPTATELDGLDRYVTQLRKALEAPGP